MNTTAHAILTLSATSSRLQRKRAVLTVASIAWGTVAILLLLAFGEGLKRQMDKNRRSTGENIAVMWMGETSKPWKGMPPGRPIRLRIDDLDLVRARMPELKAVVGEVVSWRTNLLIETEQPEQMKSELKHLNEIVGAKYGYDPSDDRALPAWDMVKSAETSKKNLIGLQLFLGIVGALTLLIGGVGVANIMYAVVKERTREIGVKMALGARQRWIIMPFVLEALVYTLIGGLLGITIATLLVSLTAFIPIENNKVMSFLGRPTLSPQIGIITSLILGLIGLMAGYFPARRAASVDPAATLRYE